MFKIIRQYFHKSYRDSMVVQSLLTLVLRVLGVLLLFGFTLFLTKNYSAHIIGQYDFVRTFLFVVGSICLLGFEQSILYFKGRLSGIKAIDGIKNTYKKMVVVLLIMSVVLYAIIFILDENWVNNYFADRNVYSMLLQATSILFFYALTVLNTEVFRALDHLYVAELFRNTIKYIPVMVGSIILLSTSQEVLLPQVFSYGFVVLGVVSSLLLLYYFRTSAGSFANNSFSYKEITTKSYPIAISGMAMFLLMSFDVLFLKKYRDDATVAYYGVAVKIITMLTMIVLTVTITISSKISEYFQAENWKELHNILKKSSRLILLISLPIALFLAVFVSPILAFFGKDYLVAKEPLLILLFGQFICAFFGSARVYLNMTGRQAIFQRTLLIAVGINFVLNRFLIPVYGMNGAAIAFVVSTFFWNIVAAIIIYKKDKLIVLFH